MTDASGLIAGRFAVDFSRRLPDAGGGLSAFAVDGSLMAVQVQRGSPARAPALHGLAKLAVANLLGPLGHGRAALPSGEAGYFVVTAAPPGAPLSAAMQAWPEHDLMEQVLRPAAAVLCELQTAGVTHRAIRPNNLFLDGSKAQVTLGCAWAEAAGHRQPASLQPAYFTVCDPGGQGDGVIADDVYALGALLVWLALGRDPLAGLDDAAIVQRKLELGSYAALVGVNRLPPAIAELVRAMLADDPEQRPAPALLTGLSATPIRRNAARLVRRAQRPLELAGETVWTLRTLADLMRRQPAQCLAPLRNGGISQWVRRGAGDIALAGRLDEALATLSAASSGDQRRTDATTILRAVAVLDPLAPLVWQGTVFWPDGLGAKLCHAMAASPASLTGKGILDEVPVEMFESWWALRSKRLDHAVVRRSTRDLLRWLMQKPLEYGAVRLCYVLSPLQPCTSPLLARAWVVALDDVLPAMEAASASGDGAAALLDQDIVAFMAVRRGDNTPPSLGQALLGMTNPTALSTLRLLAELQTGSSSAPAPHLASLLGNGIPAILARYHSRSRRERLTGRLADLVKLGDLPAMLQVLDDAGENEADALGQEQATARIETIDALISGVAGDSAARKAGAFRIGHDLALGAGMLAFGVAAVMALFF